MYSDGKRKGFLYKSLHATCKHTTCTRRKTWNFINHSKSPSTWIFFRLGLRMGKKTMKDIVQKFLRQVNECMYVDSYPDRNFEVEILNFKSIDPDQSALVLGPKYAESTRKLPIPESPDFSFDGDSWYL